MHQFLYGWAGVFLLVTTFSINHTVSFIPQDISLLKNTHSRILYKNCKFGIYAKKANGKGFGMGGGFGALSGSSSSTKVIKTRTVSGFTGSGTKPLRVAANTFDTLRKEHGKSCTNDVYVRSILNDPQIFWFVGKVARRDVNSTTVGEAVLSQKRIILEYACRELRPQNLGGKYKESLDLWVAPGDSEMDAVQNRVTLMKIEGSAAKNISETFSIADVGFNPEIYVGDEKVNGGLRIKRDNEGRPIKAEFGVNQM